MSDENGPGVITSLLPLVVWSIIPLIPAISICRRTGKNSLVGCARSVTTISWTNYILIRFCLFAMDRDAKPRHRS